MLVSPRHSWRSRVVAACLLLALPLAACHPASNEPRRPYTDADRAEALAGLPPAKDPPLSLDDEDDLERARGLYEAMPVAEDGRAARRAELVTAYVAQIDLALATSNLGAADEAFANAIGMWTMGELADEKQAAAGLAALEPTARKLYGVFARAGKDLEAATALVVIAAADPAQLAYCERVLAALMDFADDLQLATRGPGARHARPIAILEAVSARFASPWPARLLGLRYLDRQALWVKGANDPKLVMAGAQDPGIEAPVWALTRAYARMGKLALLPRVLDQIAGQRGDNPELRKIVTSAAGPEAKVDELVLLAQGFLDPRVSSEPDLATARRLAEIALERFPESDQPRRILGLVALQQGYYPLAERLLESVLRVAPTDKNVAELHARVLLAQMFDALGAERLTAADERRTRLEAIMADAKTRWKDQVFEPGLGDVWSAYGRGLYAQGRIDDAVTWLNKANAVKPSDGALETLGQIYVRRGRYQEAVAAFDAAAALPRETKVDKLVAEARLLRQAADARLLAGDRAGAETWWRATEAKWNEVLGSGVSEQQRILAFIERGRVLWSLGAREQALGDLDAAVDRAGEIDAASAFSDVIAFLFPRGGYDAALDAYHRALARSGVTEYLKVYTSLWIVAGARLRGAAPDPLAMEYLTARAGGTRWHHELARYATGRIDFAALLAKADTRGKRAEAFFYEGLARYAAGDQAGGERCMRLTLATDMMGFFEYEMAVVILQYGPPTR